MADDSRFDSIPNDVAEFLQFFAETLSELTFPDIDQASLEALADNVESQTAEVDRLEAELQQARDALQEAKDNLRRAARRGLAYAKVYADGDQALEEQLSELALSRHGDSGKPATRKRGGRGRKAKASDSGKTTKAVNGEANGELPFSPDTTDKKARVKAPTDTVDAPDAPEMTDSSDTTVTDAVRPTPQARRPFRGEEAA